MDLTASDERISQVVGGPGTALLTTPDGRSIPFRPHPYAEAFKLMSGKAFDELVEDVRLHGVRRPIVLLDDMVLDGRNRYLAAREAGVGYRVVEYVGNDPLAFVVSENRHRRHETESERAMSAARLAKLPRGANQHSSIELSGPTQRQAAEMMDVSVAAVKRAKTVIESGAPELVAAVESGEVAVTAAAEVAKLPEAEQVEIVSKGPGAVREAAKAVRQERTTKPAAPAEPTSPVDPERRALAKMTTEGLIDEVIGLRANLADEKAKSAKLKEERDELKAHLKEAQATDGGRTVANLRREITTLKGRLDQYQTDAKRYEYRAKKAEARVKELENTPIDMGAL